MSGIDEAVKVQRLHQARELCQGLEPWLDKVRGAERDRFPDLLVDMTTVQVNAPLALISVEIAAQILLLQRLKDAGLLVTPEAGNAQ